MEREVTVVGLGYVGLTTALSLSQAGVSVSGYEISEEKVRSIGRGEVPFHEPGLSELLEKCLSNGTFTVERKLVPSKIFLLQLGHLL